MIYLDNASTSFPKSGAVVDAVVAYMREVGASPGRGAHPAAQRASDLVASARRLLAELLGAGQPSAVSLTMNATHGLNLLIKGLHTAGKSVLTSPFEHNSVLRPAYALCREFGGQVVTMPLDANREIDVAAVAQLLATENFCTVVATHASNVTGRLLPIEALADLCQRMGIPFIVDVSQTAGVVPIRLDDWRVDYAAGTGHKGIGGPQGVGYLFARDGRRVRTLIEGGAGGHSLSPWHPQRGPERFEAGTPNMSGIAGLVAALETVSDADREAAFVRETQLAEAILSGLAKFSSCDIYDRSAPGGHVPIIAFNFRGMLPSQLAYVLASGYDIACRPGLHCAPLAHRMLGTYPNGTLRVSLGSGNDQSDVTAIIAALERTYQSVRHA